MIYKLAVSTAASIGLASLDIREDDHITGFVLTNTSAAAASISFGSTSQFAVNDTTAEIVSIPGGVDHAAVSGMKIPVSAGERIYLHVDSGSGTVVAMLYTDGKAEGRPAPRRR
jgi:hypothetical protein